MSKFWLMLCLLLVFAACGGPEQLPPKEIAERAAKTMVETKTIHFTINVTGAGSALGLQNAEGDIVAPDKVRGTLKLSTLGIISEIGIVGIGEQQWATNPLNNRWEVVAPGSGSFNLSTLFDAQVGIPALLRSETWTNGSTAAGKYVLLTKVDGSKLSPVTVGSITKGNVDVELAIDSQSFLVTDATLIERDTSQDTPRTWQIALRNPNAAVEVNPPPIQ